MRVCVVSFKECWASPDGRWWSSGGFPLQMAAIASLFDHMTLVVVATDARSGGMELPRAARVVPLRSPRGEDVRRKVSVVTGLPYYVRVMMREMANADVVHTPVPGDLALLGLLAGAVLRKPLIVRYGSSWEGTTETTWMNRVTKALMRRLAGGRNVMLVTGGGGDQPSQDMHWLFATAIAREELERIRPDLTRPAGRPLRAVYVGRLSSEKGVRYLIEAMGLLAPSWTGGEPPLVLTLLGDGPERAHLEALACACGCGHLVTFEGQVDRGTLLERLPQFDVCVLPSLTESFCKARLDAMLCGIPVMTTPVGFGRDIVGSDGERGWVVPAGHAGALASALERLIDGAPLDWPALRRRCRAYVEGRTLEAWIDRIGEICSRQWNVPFVHGKLCG
jgi:glycosyltransferase involved in cell wall biosynthesis